MTTIASHQTVRLARGKHSDPSGGVCVMELASMLAGERFSDHPRCVCRLVGALLRLCNDRFDDDTRQRLYPYAAAAVGSAGDQELLQRRAELCVAAVRRSTRDAGWLRRALYRRITVPAGMYEDDLEWFAGRVVGTLLRRPHGVATVLALVDELLAAGPTAPVAPPPRARRRVPAHLY